MCIMQYAITNRSDKKQPNCESVRLQKSRVHKNVKSNFPIVIFIFCHPIITALLFPFLAAHRFAGYLFYVITRKHNFRRARVGRVAPSEGYNCFWWFILCKLTHELQQKLWRKDHDKRYLVVLASLQVYKNGYFGWDSNCHLSTLQWERVNCCVVVIAVCK